MLEPAATQILATRVQPAGPNVARVELTIADAATLEEASETISVSVDIKLDRETAPLVEYQSRAIQRAVDFLSEHWRSLDKLLGN
jgi:hypothetical protein